MDIHMIKEGQIPDADDYARKFVARIKTAKTDIELINIVNKVYSDGFEDGCDSQEEIEKELNDYKKE